MFKKVYSLYSAFCTQPAFYSQSAVCILPLVRSLRFTLTCKKKSEKKGLLGLSCLAQKTNNLERDACTQLKVVYVFPPKCLITTENTV